MKHIVFMLLISFFIPSGNSHGESLYSLGRQASEAFDKGDYQKAADSYTRAQLESPDKPEISYNLGNAQYKNADYDAALNHYKAALKSQDKNLKQKTRYNMGNTYFRKNDYKKAITEYEEALKLNPNDNDARKNIEFVKKVMEQKKQNKPDDQDDKKNDKNKDKNDNKDKEKGKDPSDKDTDPDDNKGKNDENKDKKDREDKKNQDDNSRQDPDKKDPGRNEKKEGPSQGGGPQPHKGSDEQNQAENMLNRLKDNPGKALVPAYRPRQVEKDW